MNMNESFYVSDDRNEETIEIAKEIMQSGTKDMDALHVACAVLASCDFFITTDDRLLKYQSPKIQIVTPGEFIRRWEVQDNG